MLLHSNNKLNKLLATLVVLCMLRSLMAKLWQVITICSCFYSRWLVELPCLQKHYYILILHYIDWKMHYYSDRTVQSSPSSSYLLSFLCQFSADLPLWKCIMRIENQTSKLFTDLQQQVNASSHTGNRHHPHQMQRAWVYFRCPSQYIASSREL